MYPHFRLSCGYENRTKIENRLSWFILIRRSTKKVLFHLTNKSWTVGFFRGLLQYYSGAFAPMPKKVDSLDGSTDRPSSSCFLDHQ